MFDHVDSDRLLHFGSRGTRTPHEPPAESPRCGSRQMSSGPVSSGTDSFVPGGWAQHLAWERCWRDIVNSWRVLVIIMLKRFQIQPVKMVSFFKPSCLNICWGYSRIQGAFCKKVVLIHVYSRKPAGSWFFNQKCWTHSEWLVSSFNKCWAHSSKILGIYTFFKDLGCILPENWIFSSRFRRSTPGPSASASGLPSPGQLFLEWTDAVRVHGRKATAGAQFTERQWPEQCPKKGLLEHFWGVVLCDSLQLIQGLTCTNYGGGPGTCEATQGLCRRPKWCTLAMFHPVVTARSTSILWIPMGIL